MTDPDAPVPGQLPAPPPPPEGTPRKFNIRKLVNTQQGEASLLLGTATATSPQAAFDTWLSQQKDLPPEDVYRVLEAGIVSRFDFKHDTTGTYTEIKPPV